MTQALHFKCVSAFVPFVVWLVLMSSQAVVASAENRPTKYYNDAKEYTELWNFLDGERWEDGRARLESHPNEASTVIVHREFGDKGGKITLQSLPIHVILKKGNPPPDIIESLLRIHPDGCKAQDEKNELPLHIALYHNSTSHKMTKMLLLSNPLALKQKDNDGRLPLHAAAYKPTCDSVTIETLLKAYPDGINVKDGHNETVLHLASFGRPSDDALQAIITANSTYCTTTNDYSEIPLQVAAKYGASHSTIQTLLDANPSTINATDVDDGLVLHSAVGLGTVSEQSVRVLLRANPHGAKVRDKFNKLPIHSAYYPTIAAGVIKALLEYNSDGAKAKEKQGDLPIHLAAQWGVSDVTITDLLLKTYPDGAKIKSKKKKGSLPLHLALLSSNHGNTNDNSFLEHVARPLLNAYPQGAAVQDEHGDIALFIAIQKQLPAHWITDIVAAYPQGVKTKRHKNGELPIHVACAEGATVDTIKVLLEAYPESIRLRDHAHNLPLHRALAHHGRLSIETRDLLLNAYPDAVTQTNQHGQLPIHLACGEHGDVNTIQTLLEMHPNAATQKDKHGNLPIHVHLAIKYHSPESQTLVPILQSLLQAYPDSAKAFDAHQNLPIHILAFRGYATQPELDLLLQYYPESTTIKDGKQPQNLPLHLALKKAFTHDAIQSLLNHYPKAVQLQDDYGNLPLNIALMFGIPHNTILYILHQYPNAAMSVDNNGSYPIHRASRLHSPELMHALLDAYPDGVKQMDRVGRLPIHIVCEVGPPSIGVLEVLLEHYPKSIYVKDNNGMSVVDIVKHPLSGSKDAIVLPLLKRGSSFWRISKDLKQLKSEFDKKEERAVVVVEDDIRIQQLEQRLMDVVAMAASKGAIIDIHRTTRSEQNCNLVGEEEDDQKNQSTNQCSGNHQDQKTYNKMEYLTEVLDALAKSLDEVTLHKRK